MHTHAPEGYICPICLGVQGIENDKTLLKQSDLIIKTSYVSVFINSFFIGNNPGHAIVVPNEHIENIYSLSAPTAHAIIDTASHVATAIKAQYQCTGITLLQNNEPDGGQHAFHVHLHVFPRYHNDNLHSFMNNKRLASPEERLPYAEKLRHYFKNNPIEGGEHQ